MKKSLFIPSLLLTCFLWIGPLCGQGIDSTLATLKRTHALINSPAKDSALIYQYSYLAEAYSGKKDSLALIYIDSLRQGLSTSVWNKTEGLYFRALGKYHDRRGQTEQALKLYTQAIESLEKNGDQSDLVAFAYILKAFVLNNNGLVEECNKTLEQIRPLAEKLENKNYLAWILDAYADHLFYSAFGHQDIKKALEYYHQVEEILPHVKNLQIKADNAHGIGGCYLRLGDEEKALAYTNLALDIAKKNNIPIVIFSVYGDLADVYEEKGNFKEAIRYRLLSLDYAKQAKWIEMEGRAEENAAYTYKNAADYKNALFHFEKMKVIEDSLSRFAVQKSYHELEAKYESGKKDLEIQHLKGENLQLILYVLAALLTGGLLFLLYYKRTNQKLLQHNAALFEKNLEIQLALTEGQNIERKRMAIELHDNINAKIAAAKWIMETINTPEKSTEEQNVINRLVDTMSDIYEDVRFISHNLVPKDIENKSLTEIFRQLITNLNHNQKIKFTFSADGTDPGMDNALKLHCYAMTMELINNIIRHSGCRNASINLHYDKEQFIINVEDDGKGFDADAVQNGTGLKNLSSRVNSVNGSIQIEKGTNLGTSITIVIPFTRKGVGTIKVGV
ncbi:MAG TPA: ATP-binding protein [Saprospiraceae bacterium]|nr:ATP-binding protein [Saprospiraceae bacterium]